MKGFERFLVRKSLLIRTLMPKSTPIGEKRGPFLSSSRAISSSAMRLHTPVSFLNPWKPASCLLPNYGRWGSFTGQKRNMFIQTQSTPNPSSLMFYPGKPVMEVGSADFPNARTAMSSPLAKSIFAIDGTTRVFFGSDFVTVTKSDEASWDYLKPEIFAAIMDFYTSGNPLFLDSITAASKDTAIHEFQQPTTPWIALPLLQQQHLSTSLLPASSYSNSSWDLPHDFNINRALSWTQQQPSGPPSTPISN